MNGVFERDSADARRLTAALLSALGLHILLLLGVPITRFSLHWPAPQRFDVVLLPVEERPQLPESPLVAPEKAPSETMPAASESAQPAPPPMTPPPALPAQPPTVINRTALQQSPTVKRPVPPKPPVIAKTTLLPRTSSTQTAESPKRTKTAQAESAVKSIKLPKSVKPAPMPKHVPSERADSAPSVQPIARPKPVPPMALPKPVETHQPSAHRPERNTGTVASRPRSSSRPDSDTLLGQIAGLEMEKQQRVNVSIRSKRVNPNDNQSLEGFYIAAWIRKVERIGETNFPDIARKLNLTTGPVLDVHIRMDGSLSEIRIARSSGNVELDQAAQRIVRLGEPYAPFSTELRQKWDVLQISRPWRFDAGGQFQAR